MKNNNWRITEFHQITPIWLCLCHILTSAAAASWVLRAMDKHAASDLISLFNSFSPGFQILNLSRKIQKKFLLTWVQLCGGYSVGMCRGTCWPREFQQCLYRFAKCLSLFLTLKTLKTFCIKALKGIQGQAGFTALLYSCNIGVF